ncbi:MAG: DUF5069 domain-containing protein [Candidatus Eremiobacteraeota bacterium]|nr:DUF5069 domain-containing protein [Candidatus Eremiobacteraeota bacterium]
MDLTKEFPRSVHEKMHGIVQLARTTDKAKAVAHGNIGEYHYNCPMDQAVFGFLGIDHEKYLDVVKNAKSDDEVKEYAGTFIHKKTPAEIEAWNQEYVNHAPTGESLEMMTTMRKQLAPDRDDITTWADVLDLDEKRPVPSRKRTATV